MVYKRHTFNDKGSFTPGNNNGNTDTVCPDRNSIVSGYKKFMVAVCLFALICIFRAQVIDRIIVRGDSMLPNYSDGDAMWARKFGIDELERYQVIVARIDGKLVIKRVIGLPFETLQIIDGDVYINGVVLKDDFGYSTEIYGCAKSEIMLGENEYFLMGDNRDESIDCRMWGAIDINEIEGVVIFRFFPFWKMQFIE